MKIRIEAPETVKVSVQMIDGELFVSVEDNKPSLAKKEIVQDFPNSKTFQGAVLTNLPKVTPKKRSAPLDPEVKAEARRLMAAGVQQKEVARRLGIDARRLNFGRPGARSKSSKLVHTTETGESN